MVPFDCVWPFAAGHAKQLYLKLVQAVIRFFFNCILLHTCDALPNSLSLCVNVGSITSYAYVSKLTMGTICDFVLWSAPFGCVCIVSALLVLHIVQERKSHLGHKQSQTHKVAGQAGVAAATVWESYGSGNIIQQLYLLSVMTIYCDILCAVDEVGSVFCS